MNKLELLVLQDLHKKYYNKTALDYVNLTFEKGKVYGLLGPNGSGKTTLMKIVAGLHKQTSGEVYLNDQPLSYKTKANISYMPTENFLYDSFNVKETVKFYSDMYDDFDKDIAYALLEETNVDTELKTSKLSSGLLCKLKVALALSRNVELYMLDEPLNGIDILSRDTIINMITRACSANKTIIISTHIVYEIEKIIDSVIFLKNGTVVLHGDSEELREKHELSIEEIYKEVFRNA